MDEQEKETARHHRKSSEAPEFNFESVYANNAHFESSVWDLKIIFGQLEQHITPPEIEWHTAVTMPWAAAKIWSYYLRLAIAVHEAGNGIIGIPNAVRPPIPQPPSEGLPKDSADWQGYYQVRKWYEEIFGPIS